LSIVDGDIRCAASRDPFIGNGEVHPKAKSEQTSAPAVRPIPPEARKLIPNVGIDTDITSFAADTILRRGWPIPVADFFDTIGAEPAFPTLHAQSSVCSASRRASSSLTR
jgi:hypothetical protein